jgi:2,4-diaminopentanoate dehydrogenase
MRSPYKVMVWGPGKMGLVATWEVLQSDAFELVGVRAYSESKEGVDIGTLMGIEPVGINATTDADKLLELDCDCIIYTALDTGDFNTDAELLQLLTAGKNVVTPLPYQNMHFFRDADTVAAFNAACETGDAVFHATGVDPDIISDRVLLSLTGLCTDITSIKLQEFWECSAGHPQSLEFIGFGKSVEEVESAGIASASTVNFLKAIALTAESVLGVNYDRLEMECEYLPTPKDIDQPIAVKKGTVARMVHRMCGFVDDRGSEPFFTIEYNWLMSYDMLPEGVTPDQYWLATIEGRPSLKMSIDIKASHKTGERFYQFGNFNSEPGYHATIAPCLQAIPHICQSAPGVIPSFGPGLHWMADLRDTAG